MIHTIRCLFSSLKVTQVRNSNNKAGWVTVVTDGSVNCYRWPGEQFSNMYPEPSEGFMHLNVEIPFLGIFGKKITCTNMFYKEAYSSGGFFFCVCVHVCCRKAKFGNIAKRRIIKKFMIHLLKGSLCSY